MDYLLDTNILLRWSQVTHPLSPLVQDAVERLYGSGERAFVTPQNLIEFWNVATRPTDRNGFGMKPSEASLELSKIETLFLLAPDTPEVYPTWRRLVLEAEVSGVKVHDARLAAAIRCTQSHASSR